MGFLIVAALVFFAFIAWAPEALTKVAVLGAWIAAAGFVAVAAGRWLLRLL